MMDELLELWVGSLIETAKVKWVLGSGRYWRPGEKLKLLFAGYNGTRNTGSDVRVHEMLRQIMRILGDGRPEERLQLSVMTQNFELTKGYFGGARQVRLPDLFPPFLYSEVPRHDGVVACEGSMFKSKFANALTAMMIGSLGIASAQNKLSVGYGAEAGYMDPLLAKMCARYCRDSLVITRNEESRAVLRELGVPSELGTDTAWTFEPMPPDYARKLLRASGWDGQAPVLAVCPINPFWWPVKASLAKAAARALTGAYRQSHYRSIYFHTDGPEARAAYKRYINSMARALERFRAEYRAFPVLVAMEQLDADACEQIAAIVYGAPVFKSSAFDMFRLVSLLRACDLMVSSRYHGIVTSMPALVPSAGVTMDERIRNLMRERGHADLLLEVDDPELEDRVFEVMRKLVAEREAIQQGIARTVVENLKKMARMGVYFEEHVHQRYPDFPLRSGMLSWEEYLPPLSPCLANLVENYG